VDITLADDGTYLTANLQVISQKALDRALSTAQDLLAGNPDIIKMVSEVSNCKTCKRNGRAITFIHSHLQMMCSFRTTSSPFCEHIQLSSPMSIRNLVYGLIAHFRVGSSSKLWPAQLAIVASVAGQPTAEQQQFIDELAQTMLDATLATG
jgi:hypothetical protein